MTTCDRCLEEVANDQTVIVNGLVDRPGISEVCRDCLDAVLRSRSLRPATLREELDGIFDGEGVA